MSEVDPSITGFGHESNADELFKVVGDLVSTRIAEAVTLNESFGVRSNVWKFDIEIDEKILTPDNEKPSPGVVITAVSSIETSKTRGLGIAIVNSAQDGSSEDTYTLYGVHRNKKTGLVEKITSVDIDPEGFFGTESPDEEEDVANIAENLNLEAVVGLANNDCVAEELVVLKEILNMSKPRVPDFDERLFSMIVDGNFPRIITDF